MLLKKRRISKKEVDLVFKRGRSVSSALLTFKFVSSNHPTPARTSFIAPKSVAKDAAKRNSLRRLGYSALEKYMSQFPSGAIGVFLFKKVPSSNLEIENEIKSILHKIN